MAEQRVIPVTTHISAQIFGAAQAYAQRGGLGLNDALAGLVQEGLVRVGLWNFAPPSAQEGQGEAQDEEADYQAIVVNKRLYERLERAGIRTIDGLLSRILAGTLQEIDGIGPSTERQIVEGLVAAGYITVGVGDGNV